MSPAGYSGTPLAKKLGIKPGSRYSTPGAPADFAATLRPLPEDTALVGARGKTDLVLLFELSASKLPKTFAAQAKRLPPDGALWVAWPKKSSGVATDLTFDIVRETGIAAGLVDVKVCAVDETWSGLKFVVRVADRPPRSAARKAAV